MNLQQIFSSQQRRSACNGNCRLVGNAVQNLGIYCCLASHLKCYHKGEACRLVQLIRFALDVQFKKAVTSDCSGSFPIPPSMHNSSLMRLFRIGLHPARYEKIVVAADFSALSDAAFRTAADLAQGTPIDLVHIVDIPLQFEQTLLKADTPQDEIERYRQG